MLFCVGTTSKDANQTPQTAVSNKGLHNVIQQGLDPSVRHRTLSMLRKMLSIRRTEIFFIFFIIFPSKTDFDISCHLSPIICSECQSLFSGKKKKIIINLASAKLAQRVVKVYPLQKHAYSNIKKISPPKTDFFIKTLIFFIFLLKKINCGTR